MCLLILQFRIHIFVHDNIWFYSSEPKCALVKIISDFKYHWILCSKFSLKTKVYISMFLNNNKVFKSNFHFIAEFKFGHCTYLKIQRIRKFLIKKCNLLKRKTKGEYVCNLCFEDIRKDIFPKRSHKDQFKYANFPNSFIKELKKKCVLKQKNSEEK